MTTSIRKLVEITGLKYATVYYRRTHGWTDEEIINTGLLNISTIPAKWVKSSTAMSWRAMNNRCNNPNAADYPRYGGRGITVCPEWQDFQQFLADMGERPEGMTLDRKDNDGNYAPDNCRWADTLTQNNNRSNCHLITYNKQTLTIAEWSRKTMLTREIIAIRLRRGWSIERTLTTPARSYR